MGGKAEPGLQDAPWAELVLLCGKCARRQSRKGLKGELKGAWKAAGKPGKLRVVETACLGLCPKDGVATATATGLGRGEVVVLRAKEDAAGAFRTG